MTRDQFCISVLISLVECVVALVAIIVAIFGGDVAAYLLQTCREKKQAKKARSAALRSLLNEVERIRQVEYRHKRLDHGRAIEGIPRMPVAAFEKAFVSGTEVLEVSDQLLKDVSDYLVAADLINSLVELHGFAMAAGGSGGMRPNDVAEEIRQRQSDLEGMSAIIKRLKAGAERQL
jgi:hypothetical protein